MSILTKEIRYLKNVLIAYLISNLMSACTREETDIIPYNVDIPVMTPCVEEIIPAPLFYLDKLNKDASDVAKLKAVLADRELEKAYSAALLSQLRQCSSS